MTKSKIIAATLAVVTLTGAVLGTSAPAFAWGGHHHHHGFGAAAGIGLAVGTMIGIAAASNAYAAEPVYECHYVRRYNRWGHVRLIRVCDDAY